LKEKESGKKDKKTSKSSLAACQSHQIAVGWERGESEGRGGKQLEWGERVIILRAGAKPKKNRTGVDRIEKKKMGEMAFI